MTLDLLDDVVRLVGIQALRIVAAFWVLPLFGPHTPTRLLRFGLGLTVGVTVALARGLDLTEAPPEHGVALAVVAAQEIMLGLLLGWSAGLILDAASICGALIATEMGINLADQVDPTMRHSVPLLAFLFQNLALVLFFAVGGHGMVLGALITSFDRFPVGGFPAVSRWAPFLLEWSGQILATGVRIAAPVFLVMVVVTLGVGFLAKVAPNLGVLEASYPIRILAALLLMVLFLPHMMDAFELAFHQLGLGFSRFLGAR